MRIAVLDYGMGNLRSVARALEVAGGEVVVTSSETAITAAEALCVPGQGIFGRCIDNLTAAGHDALVRGWISDDRPYLGICLGMQILFDGSEEGAHDGLGPVAGLSVWPGEVRRLNGAGVRVPHMGWNTVGEHHYYFDHSYAVWPADESLVTGWCTHGERFAAALARGSVGAFQFHPEKSGAAGIEVLRRWMVAARTEAVT